MSLIKKIANNIKLIGYLFGKRRKQLIDDMHSERAQLAGKYKLFGNNYTTNCRIGKYSYLAHNAIAFNCTIGNFCSVGPNVVIGYGDHPQDLLSTNPNVYFQLLNDEEKNKLSARAFLQVTIKNDVWIGANVYVKNGVTIGNGAVIGANSFVNNDVPPFAIVVGTPARIIKYRFDQTTIEEITASEWWDNDVEKINKDLFKKFSSRSSFVA